MSKAQHYIVSIYKNICIRVIHTYIWVLFNVEVLVCRDSYSGGVVYSGGLP